MARIIVAIVVGFVVWSVLWVGSDFVLTAVSPDWYGSHHTQLEAAALNRTPFMSDSLVLIIALIRSVTFSLISGFLAASIARENAKSTFGLGVLLLLFGIYIQSIFWNNAPLWYHIAFLALLIPMTILGGKLKRI